jgi:hypothetical protein
MTECNECKSFFPQEKNLNEGDCIQGVNDPRQAYYQSRPVKANNDAMDCPLFQKKHAS